MDETDERTSAPLVPDPVDTDSVAYEDEDALRRSRRLIAGDVSDAEYASFLKKRVEHFIKHAH